MSNASPGAGLDQVARAEFTRRQTLMQRQATDAAIAAANAAEETAQFTRDNARYMLWSVIVLAAASAGTLIVAIIGLYRH